MAFAVPFGKCPVVGDPFMALWIAAVCAAALVSGVALPAPAAYRIIVNWIRA
jgi:hypothetical protein